MEQSTSQEAAGSSARQEIPYI